MLTVIARPAVAVVQLAAVALHMYTALYYAVRVWLRLYGVFGRIKDVSSSRRITDPLNSPYLYTCRGIDCLRLGIVMYANAVMLVAALTCSHAI